MIGISDTRMFFMEAMTMFRGNKVLLTALFVVVGVAYATAQQGNIDWNRAREFRQRSLQGEKLTEEEQSYLQRAIELRKQGNPQQRRPVEIKPPVGLKPLTDMSGDERYKGQDGGIYGGGNNTPPKEHLEAALQQAKLIQPLDAEGKPGEDGKIVLISNGMSNTTQEFQAFMRLASQEPVKSASVVIVDGAQGGMEASDWAKPEERYQKERPDPWTTLARRLEQADVSPQQVQVAWIKQARRNPESLGEFPKHALEMKEDMVTILNRLKETFPNLRIAYLSSRIYAGYAKSALNPEPYAYESAFTVRWLIQDQIKGEPWLNYDPQKGAAKSPLLLWGPYLWADGENGRKIDSLVWKPEDYAGDGTHPGNIGREKVAELLLGFMKTDPTAKVWFVK